MQPTAATGNGGPKQQPQLNQHPSRSLALTPIPMEVGRSPGMTGVIAAAGCAMTGCAAAIGTIGAVPCIAAFGGAPKDCAICLPHFLQKFAPPQLSAPQLGQNTMFVWTCAAAQRPSASLMEANEWCPLSVC